jgi:hypothetical protein
MSTVQGGQGNIVTSGLILNLDAANPRSYLPPYNGTTWFDLSGNNNNGTLTNGPTFNTGSGGNIVFDGVDDYVLTPYSGSSTSSYTFASWYNPLSNVNTYALTRGRDGNGNGWSLTLGSDNTSGNRYRAGAVKTDGGTVGYVTYSTGSMVLNQWVYLTGVWVSGNSINLYVNGIFHSLVSTTGTTLRTSTDGWVLGSITTTAYSNEQVAVSQIYNRALSASEINQNFQATRARFGI